MASYSSYSVSFVGGTSGTITVTFTYPQGTAPATSPITGVALNGTALTHTDTLSGDKWTVVADVSSMYTILQGILDVTFSTPGDDLETIVPLLAVNYDDEGTNSPTMQVASSAFGNGMIHVGLYESATALTSDPLTPVWGASSDTDPIKVYTQTAFIDSYDAMDAAAVARKIVSDIKADSAFPKDYDIVAVGTTVTFTKPGETPYLYIHIFDDNLIQSINANPAGPGDVAYKQIAAGTYGAVGVLPVPPEWDILVPPPEDGI
jgi:hypothetical protein